MPERSLPKPYATAKAIRDFYKNTGRPAPIHYKCLIHKMRALVKHLKQLSLKSIRRGRDKKAYLHKLTTAIRARVRFELATLRKQSRTDVVFIRSASSALENVTACFSGDHRMCPHTSSACPSNPQPNYKHLPYGEPLELNEADLHAVNSTLNKVFDAKVLQEICKLYNTNMCESLNSAVFNVVPKSSCYTRNFLPLCHSATHSRTVGPGKGTIKLATAAGMSVPKNSIMHVNLTAKDRLRQYHCKRKASQKYKKSRHVQRKRKGNKALFKDSLYSTENQASGSAHEHNYGLRN